MVLCLAVLVTGLTANAAYDRSRHLKCRDAIASVQHWAYEVQRSEFAIRHADRICGFSHRCRRAQVQTYEYNLDQLHAAEYRRAQYFY